VLRGAGFETSRFKTGQKAVSAPWNAASASLANSALPRLDACHGRRRLSPPQQVIQKRPCHHRQLSPRRVHGIPVTQDGKALDVEDGELAGLVEREGVARERGDAQAGEDGLLDGFVAAEFQSRADDNAVFIETALDGVAALRVPEPFSRISQGSCARRSRRMFFLCASG